MLDWHHLATKTDDELAAYDVAAVNLACAVSLPGAEQINEFECIDRLNHYTRCTEHFTRKRLPEFQSAPEVYKHSEARFRVVCMIKLLQQQFGVRYNLAKVPAEAVFDTADTFIHGALMGDGGTCASLPVVYAAVGRRLGYPLKLVPALRHLFARWEDDRERFNIEVNDHSINDPPDDHYRTGRYAVTKGQERQGCLLRSMTPRQELAYFLSQRACCRADDKDYRRAARGFAWASLLHPENKLHACGMVGSLNIWQPLVEARFPPVLPNLTIVYPPKVFSNMPDGLEQELVRTDVIDMLQNDEELMRVLRHPLVRAGRLGHHGGLRSSSRRALCGLFERGRRQSHDGPDHRPLDDHRSHRVRGR